MEGHVMVNFLPTILNQLFCVLTRTTQEDVAVNVTRQATHSHTDTHALHHTCMKFLVSNNSKPCVTAVFLVPMKTLPVENKNTLIWVLFHSAFPLFYISLFYTR